MSDQLYNAAASVLFKSGEIVHASGPPVGEEHKTKLEGHISEIVGMISSHYREEDAYAAGYIQIGDTSIRLADTSAITLRVEVRA